MLKSASSSGWVTPCRNRSRPSSAYPPNASPCRSTHSRCPEIMNGLKVDMASTRALAKSIRGTLAKMAAAGVVVFSA